MSNITRSRKLRIENMFLSLTTTWLGPAPSISSTRYSGRVSPEQPIPIHGNHSAGNVLQVALISCFGSWVGLHK